MLRIDNLLKGSDEIQQSAFLYGLEAFDSRNKFFFQCLLVIFFVKKNAQRDFHRVANKL